MKTIHRTAYVAAMILAVSGTAASANIFDALFRPLSLAPQQPYYQQPYYPQQQQPYYQQQPSETTSSAYRAPEMVLYAGPYKAGTVVVNATERRLYLVMTGGKAMRYSVGVAREGFEWSGVKHISQKQEWPDWRPPAEMIQRRPDLPRYVAGGPQNPMGARALYLGDSLYRIHGSNEPATIGHATSSGCIRMLNDDVVDLYARVHVGTQVVVTR